VLYNVNLRHFMSTNTHSTECFADISDTSVHSISTADLTVNHRPLYICHYQRLCDWSFEDSRRYFTKIIGVKRAQATPHCQSGAAAPSRQQHDARYGKQLALLLPAQNELSARKLICCLYKASLKLYRGESPCRPRMQPLHRGCK
jgi:hypothetical protein